MRLSVKGFAIAVGTLWAASVLLVGIAHLASPTYGGAFLDLASSIYPGFNPAGGAVAVFVGTIYAIIDGAVGGAAFAWLYNMSRGD